MKRRRVTHLTIRGRSFLAAGAATLAVGSLMGLTELVRIGAFVFVLPLGSWLWVSLRRHRLVLTRTGVPSHLPVGTTAPIGLSIHNAAANPTGLLLMTEQVPRELGGPPRFAVDSLRHGGRRRIGYVVRGIARGEYEIGPLEARLVDPFGFVDGQQVFPGRRTVVVTPEVITLPRVPLPAGPTGIGDRRARRFLIGSADDSTVRDYRRGDDLRRIHWRSTAHHDELMVRSEEQPWHSRATLVLDTRIGAYPDGGAERFEKAVSLAASVAVHLIRRDFSIRLISTDGVDLTSGWHGKGDARAVEEEILRKLALVTQAPVQRLAPDLAAGTGADELAIGVFGALSDSDVAALDSFVARGTWNVAFTLAGVNGPGYPWVWERVLPNADLATDWSSALSRLRTGRTVVTEST